jgi:hypothetical protein
MVANLSHRWKLCHKAIILVAELGQLGGGGASLLGVAAPVALVSRKGRTCQTDRVP